MSKKGRGYPATAEVHTNLNIDDFEVALVHSLSQRELLKLIIQIDADVQDWDFTLKLHKHFSKLNKDYEKVQPELAAEKHEHKK
jgi:hypothetical protein